SIHLHVCLCLAYRTLSAEPFILLTAPASSGRFSLSLHDALPIYLTVIISLGWTAASIRFSGVAKSQVYNIIRLGPLCMFVGILRSEEHTSELQSRENLVCRLLLEKKKGTIQGQFVMRLISTIHRQ